MTEMYSESYLQIAFTVTLFWYHALLQQRQHSGFLTNQINHLQTTNVALTNKTVSVLTNSIYNNQSSQIISQTSITLYDSKSSKFKSTKTIKL